MEAFGPQRKEIISATLPAPHLSAALFRSRRFALGLDVKRPLTALSVVTAALDLRPRHVSNLIEAGKLRWAFDIRTRSARAREVRIWRESILEFAGLQPPPNPPMTDDEEFTAILLQILPPEEDPPPPPSPIALVFCHVPRPEPSVSAAILARSFSCAEGHIANLIRNRLLLPAGKNSRGRLLVTRASVIQFLRQRRIL